MKKLWELFKSMFQGKPVIIPSTIGGTKVEKYALLVGINKYLLPGNDLNGCVNDTQAMWEVLTTYYGVKPDNIRVLNNERATQQAILERLQWGVDIAKEGVEFIWQYSGHGSQVRDREGDELKDGLDEIICPHDLDWDNPFTDDLICKYFKKMTDKGAKVVFIVDACHSGTMTRTITASEYPIKKKFISPPFDIAARSLGRKLKTRKIGSRGFLGNDNVTFIDEDFLSVSGCKDEQTSADAYISGKYQGALTATLVEVIKENSESNWIEVHKKVVKKLAERGYDQIPQLTGKKETLNGILFGGK